MKHLQHLFLMAFVLLCCSPSNAQMGTVTYFLHDGSCLQKYDYKETGNFPRVEFADYHLRISPNAKAVFRVDKLDIYESTAASLDKIPLGCDDANKVSKTFVADVNNSRKVAYIVSKKSDNLYILYKVDRIAMLVENDAFLSFEDKRHDFDYMYDKIYTEDIKNLSLMKDKGAKVLLSGNREKLQCVNIRKFRSFSKHPDDPFEDIEFLENIGLYKMTVAGAEMRLVSINGQPLDQIISATCGSGIIGEEIDNGGNTDVAQNGGTNNNPFGNNNSNGFGGTDITVVKVDTSPPVKKNPCEGISPFDTDHPCNQTIVDHIGDHSNPKDQQITTTQINGVSHIVKLGEQLNVIAKKYGTPVETIKCLNRLPDDRITAGQELIVTDPDGICKDGGNPGNQMPPPQISDDDKPKKHQVRRGQTLADIAKQYNSHVAILQCLNKFNSTNPLLRTGDIILVIRKPGTPECPEPRKPIPVAGKDQHKVGPGENLYIIAEKYGTTTATIMCLNNLSSDIIGVDQILTVIDRVGDCGETKLIREIDNEQRIVKMIHVVRKGETLSSIAAENGYDGWEPLRTLNPWLDNLPKCEFDGVSPRINVNHKIVVSLRRF